MSRQSENVSRQHISKLSINLKFKVKFESFSSFHYTSLDYFDKIMSNGITRHLSIVTGNFFHSNSCVGEDIRQNCH